MAELHPVVKFFWQQTYSVQTYMNRLRLSVEDFEDLFVRSSSVLASASRSDLTYLQQRHATNAYAELLRACTTEVCSSVELNHS